MPPEWTADRAISPAQAEGLITLQFPLLGPVHAELLGVGWDNTAFLVNGNIVFRFPRRQIAVPLLETETRMLPAIAPRLPLAVPNPQFVGRPTNEFPWPFAGYKLGPGQPLCRASFDDSQRCALAEPLGRFLAALHAFPRQFAISHGAPGDNFRRMDVPYRRAKAESRLGYLVERGLIGDAAPFRRVLDAAPPEYRPRGDTLVHGDLYSLHILVDDDGIPTGVIDWGDVHVGDPAVDLAIAFILLPPEARHSFCAAYGSVSDTTRQMARFRAAYHTLTVAAYAHQTDDADLLRESRLALKYITADD